MASLAEAVAEAEIVFHLAAMPGLVIELAGFRQLSDARNVQATQRLLEAVRSARRPAEVLLRSPPLLSTASSVQATNRCDETDFSLRRHQACRRESLQGLRGRPRSAARYFALFSVYVHASARTWVTTDSSPRCWRNEPIVVYGDGQQVRGNTFVSDCVSATIAAVRLGPGKFTTSAEVRRRPCGTLFAAEALAGRE